MALGDGASQASWCLKSLSKCGPTFSQRYKTSQCFVLEQSLIYKHIMATHRLFIIVCRKLDVLKQTAEEISSKTGNQVVNNCY